MGVAGDLGALLLTGDPAGVLAPDWRSRIGAEDADRPAGDVARPGAAAPPAARSLPPVPPAGRVRSGAVPRGGAHRPAPGEDRPFPGDAPPPPAARRRGRCRPGRC